jgi:hypothetical protein
MVTRQRGPFSFHFLEFLFRPVRALEFFNGVYEGHHGAFGFGFGLGQEHDMTPRGFAGICFWGEAKGILASTLSLYT